MEAYKKLESEASIIRYVVLVLLGAGINFTIGFGVVFSSLTALVQSPSQALTSTGLPTSVAILVVCYFIIGIIYSTSVSLAFQPKRIISPLYIQITTSSFVPILIVYLLLTVPSTIAVDWSAISGIAIFLFLVSFLMFFVAGIGQIMIVRYLVGLNGTKENINSFGLVINGKLEDVLKVLKSDGSQEALYLSKRDERKTGEHSFVFRTPRGTRKQLFIAIIADPNDNKKTQLATVSYVQTYYGIMKTGDLIKEERKHTIKSALEKAGMTFSDDETDSLARYMAYDHGLSITESKLLTLRSYPPYSKAILVGITLMAIIMSALWKVGYITPEMYETFWIFAGFAVLFDLLPLLRTERRRAESD